MKGNCTNAKKKYHIIERTFHHLNNSIVISGFNLSPSEILPAGQGKPHDNVFVDLFRFKQTKGSSEFQAVRVL